MQLKPAVIPTGESALTVVFGDSVELGLNNRVLAMDDDLLRDPIEGVIESIPAVSSLLLRFDPGVISREELTTAVISRAATGALNRQTGRSWQIPVRYGGEGGPDLSEVADVLGLSESATIEAHSALEMQVLMLGFAPGFAYMGVAGSRWDLERRRQLHPKVPAGSVLVAVRQTALSGTPIPTGWHCIARTPVPTFRPLHEDPFLLRPGDTVSFEAISERDFTRLAEHIDAGTFTLVPMEDE